MSSKDEPTRDKSGSEIKALRLKISLFKGQITRANNFALEQQPSAYDYEGIQLRINMLENSYQEYLKNMLQIKLLLDETADTEFDQDEVEERWFSSMARLRGMMRSYHGREAGNQTSEAHHSNKLPQLDIACFSGSDITQYTPFMETFQAIVGSEKTLTGVQKLCYLKKYLQGDALLLIDSLPLMCPSYNQALELLDKRYNNKCLLVTHHVNSLLDFQPVSKGTSQELRHLVSVMRYPSNRFQRSATDRRPSEPVGVPRYVCQFVVSTREPFFPISYRFFG